jgi:hypothetical protein
VTAAAATLCHDSCVRDSISPAAACAAPLSCSLAFLVVDPSSLLSFWWQTDWDRCNWMMKMEEGAEGAPPLQVRACDSAFKSEFLFGILKISTHHDILSPDIGINDGLWQRY